MYQKKINMLCTKKDLFSKYIALISFILLKKIKAIEKGYN
jgi:hypothetical protein